MNTSDAAELAQLLAKTWRGGPHPDIWAEELETLHHSQARHTYLALRRSEEHAPTVARFLAHYRSLTTSDDEKIDCLQCDGSGAVNAENWHGPYCNRTDHCHCHAVVACSCLAGQAMRKTIADVAASGKRKYSSAA